MRFRMIGGMLLIFGALIALLKNIMLWFILIVLIGFVLWIVIRLLADLFWWGKDKGKW